LNISFQGNHEDYIFDLTWIDDQFLVSGSRDGTMALWKIGDEILNQTMSSESPVHARIEPIIK